jgi:hypothetical protein
VPITGLRLLLIELARLWRRLNAIGALLTAVFAKMTAREVEELTAVTAPIAWFLLD